MKRVLTILAILLLPLSVWAMTPVSDSDLSNVTGQAGVSINADLTMNITIGTMAWGDSDGTKAYWGDTTTGGFVGMDNFNLNGLRIRARVETDDNWYLYSTLFLKPITIDVASNTAYNALSGQTGATTFVRFGLGALQISLNAMSFNVGTGAWAAAGSPVTINQLMGSVNLGGIEIYMSPLSYVDIFSHLGQGVNFSMDVTIDRFEMGYLSWGDSDGLPGGTSLGTVQFTGPTTSAGYVGLNGLTLGSPTSYAVKIAGNVAIDVMTSAAGVGVYSTLPPTINVCKAYWIATFNGGVVPTTPAELLAMKQWILANGAAVYANIAADPDTYAGASYLAPIGLTGNDATAWNTSVVHISFPGGFSVNMGSLRSQVCVSDVASLNSGFNTGVMGDIYLQSLGINILNGSWVDIWAH